MDRNSAAILTKQKLNELGLSEWSVRLITNHSIPFLGKCDYKNKTIFLNAHHIDQHPEPEVKDTILHEIAHALCPGQGHNEVWEKTARNLGVTNTLPCSHLNINPVILDAIRSGATVEVEFTEQVIRTPSFKVTRLQEKCEFCGKVAEELTSFTTHDTEGNEIKVITLKCYHIIKKVIPRATPFQDLISNHWKPEVKNCNHIWNKTVCEVCGEFKLYNFQVESARFAEVGLSVGRGVGIFHEMGLGKTVIGLAYLKFHPELTPTLFVVKSAIKFQWFKEIIRWIGPSHIPQIINTAKDYIFPNLKCYIIAYDLLRRFPKEKLDKLGIKLVILDECQQIKNPDSTRTQEVRRLVKDAKIIALSGTPWKNRGSEFFPILNILDPIKFHSHQGFIDNWVEYYYEGARRKEGGIKRIPAFKEYIKDIVTRKEYDEVMDEFPDVNRTKLNIELDAIEQKTYNEEVSEFVKWYNNLVLGGEEDSIDSLELLARMSRMRHLTGLAKIPATIEFVEEFLESTGKKITIFVHHKDVSSILAAQLHEKFKDDATVKVFHLTADYTDAERFTIAENFNRHPKSILVASTLASGEGINLQTCADSIMHERQWNPQNEDQAAPGRFKRIGQKSKTINVTFAEASGTIDEHLGTLVEKKRKYFHEVMNKGEMPSWNESSFAKELAEIIVSDFAKQNKVSQMVKGKVRR